MSRGKLGLNRGVISCGLSLVINSEQQFINRNEHELTFSALHNTNKVLAGLAAAAKIQYCLSFID